MPLTTTTARVLAVKVATLAALREDGRFTVFDGTVTNLDPITQAPAKPLYAACHYGIGLPLDERHAGYYGGTRLELRVTCVGPTASEATRVCLAVDDKLNGLRIGDSVMWPRPDYTALPPWEDDSITSPTRWLTQCIFHIHLTRGTS